jgi:hypothetical protein
MLHIEVNVQAFANRRPNLQQLRLPIASNLERATRFDTTEDGEQAVVALPMPGQAADVVLLALATRVEIDNATGGSRLGSDFGRLLDLLTKTFDIVAEVL